MGELENNAKAMVAPGKGILAADESSPTIKKRFDSIGAESTEENRRFYRDMLFTTAGAEKYISGVILFDETIRQKSADGTPFPQLLQSKGIIPGIKVDKGAKDLPGAPGEKVTEGLDGLRDRVNARGSGRRSRDVRGLIGRFDQMREMMANLGSKGGLLSRIPGLGDLAGAGAGGLDPTNLLGSGAGVSRREASKRRSRQKGKRKQARKSRKKNRRH